MKRICALLARSVSTCIEKTEYNYKSIITFDAIDFGFFDNWSDLSGIPNISVNCPVGCVGAGSPLAFTSTYNYTQLHIQCI